MAHIHCPTCGQWIKRKFWSEHVDLEHKYEEEEEEDVTTHKDD